MTRAELDLQLRLLDLKLKQREQEIKATPGPKGDRGDRGLDGKDGPQGLKGDQGERGEKGDRGQDGKEVGPQGARGEKGDRGETGPQGLKGDRGLDGKDGLHGLKGDRGARGEKGDRGEAGPLGERGEDGTAGVAGEGFTWRGDWNERTKYNARDVVAYFGSSWVKTKLTTLRLAPDMPNSGWDLMVRRGLDGGGGGGTTVTVSEDNANGLQFDAGELSLLLAAADQAGAMGTGPQTFAGVKSFTSTPVAPGLSAPSDTQLILTSKVLSGASAVGFIANCENDLLVSGGLHTSFRVAGVEKIAINRLGNIVPTVGETNQVGTAGKYFLSVYSKYLYSQLGMWDAGFNERIGYTYLTGTRYTSRAPDSDSAQAHVFDCIAQTIDGGKLIVVKNGGVEQVNINKYGTLQMLTGNIIGNGSNTLGDGYGHHFAEVRATALFSATGVRDDSGAQRLIYSYTSGSSYFGNGADVSGAVAHTLDCYTPLTNSNARLLVIKNGSGAVLLGVNKDGAPVPTSANTGSIGTASLPFGDIYGYNVSVGNALSAYNILVGGEIKDGLGTTRISAQNGARTYYNSDESDVSGAIGHRVSTARALTASDALLTRWDNNLVGKAGIDKDGNVEVFPAGGSVVLASPDGTRYRITVANGGTIAVAAA